MFRCHNLHSVFVHSNNESYVWGKVYWGFLPLNINILSSRSWSHSAYINYVEQQMCGKPWTFLLLLFQPLFSILFFSAFLLVPFCFSPLLLPFMLFLPSNTTLRLPLPQSSPGEIMRVYQGALLWLSNQWSLLQQSETGGKEREEDEHKNPPIATESGNIWQQEW